MEDSRYAPTGLRGNSYKKVEDWTGIFDKYEVDLVLQGHNHEYSRSYPLRGGTIVPEGEIPKGAYRGTVYVVTNASGRKFNEKKRISSIMRYIFKTTSKCSQGLVLPRIV